MTRGEFFSTCSSLFELGSDDAMGELGDGPGIGPFEQYKVVQHHRDVPVIGAGYNHGLPGCVP